MSEVAATGISVLLVDDHPIVRQGYRRVLESQGDLHVVAEADNAADAYSAFKTHDPDVVVRWAPDGKSIFYNNAANDRTNIYRQPLDGGPAVKVTAFADNLASEFAVARDGKSLLLTRINLMRDAMLVTGFE